MSLVLIGGALGGLGLFLLGMRLMTEGLKIAAGGMLRDVLARWTRTRLRGLLSGILITGVVQSSSAVTVATIGFVNAGLLTLGQAIWVIFGSNVGTTITGWIVALVGFDIRIEAFALPLLGIGMFLSLTGPSTRRGALGEAVAGFGVFFLGIATLKATFAGLAKDIDLGALAEGGILGDMVFVAVGIGLTTLLQSSSAVIALALTAAAGGVLGLESGAALIIGANVGTTTTAVFAVIGATSNARRVAVGHVIFNGLTGATALILLPLMLIGLRSLENTLPAGGEAVTTLALFHTVFNLLGVLLIWPLAGWLERWLAGRFVTREEDESRPRFLDKTGLQVPALAVNSVMLELRRVADIALGVADAALTRERATPERLQPRAAAIEPLTDAIVQYIQQIHAGKSTMPTAEALGHPIRALWHFSEIADLAIALAARRSKIEHLPAAHRDAIAALATLVAAQVDATRRSLHDGAAQPPEMTAFEPAYQRAKTGVLTAASAGGITAHQADAALESLSDMKEIMRLLDRAGKRVAALAAVAENAVAPASAPDSVPDSTPDAATTPPEN